MKTNTAKRKCKFDTRTEEPRLQRIEDGGSGGGFPGGSAGKESVCNAGDLGMIPGLGRSPEGGMATPSSILPGEFHGQRILAGYSP